MRQFINPLTGRFDMVWDNDAPVQSQVTSVNWEAWAVVLNTDDIDDSHATNKYTTAEDIERLADTSWTNTGDQTASDFDIKDLADSTDLRQERSWKQDELIAGANIAIAADGKTISATDTTYSTATSTTEWLVKLWDDTVQSVAPNNPSTTVDRTYPVQLDSNWKAVVNVPRASYAASDATSSTAWVVKLFSDTEQSVAANNVSSTAGRTYWIQENSSNQMVVNVPWTDHTYSATDFDIKDLTDSDGLRNTWSWKQDALTAGANISIDGNNEISATDTTYTASDFDIKDLTDSDDLRTTWSGKASTTYADQHGPIIPVYKTHWSITSSKSFTVSVPGTYKMTVIGARAGISNRTVTISADWVTAWTYTLNYTGLFNICEVLTANISMWITIEADTTITDIIIEKIDVQSWYISENV